MNVLSLFDGISCGQIALNKANIKYENYFASEINKSAIKITQHNYPNTIQLGDVSKIKGSDLPKIDLLIGGSPCQGFSFAGKRLNFNDPKSKLFFEFIRLKNELKPKYYLLENVNMTDGWVNIITKQLSENINQTWGDTILEWQNEINEEIYNGPIRINSKLVSASNRDRLYWTNIPNIKLPKDKNISFDDINSNNENWIDEKRINTILNWKSLQKPLEYATLIGSKSKLPCLTARGYNRNHSGMILITNGQRYRYLTNEEAEQALTIPVGYTSIASDIERSHAIGNSWTVDVISHIFSHIG